MAITNLTNTSWYFNETLDHCGIGNSHSIYDDDYHSVFHVDIVWNGIQYTTLDYDLGMPNIANNMSYYGGDNYVDGTQYEDGWLDESYRTITITGGDDVENPDLITWITSNATQVEISTPDTPSGTTISYNGSIIATIQSGETVTLRCAGKKMDGDVIVEAAEATGGGIEVPMRTITYEVGEGFNTVILTYVTVENDTVVSKSVEASANSNGSITFLAYTGIQLESTEVTDSWGESSYPSISVDDTGGYFVGEQGANASMVYIPAVSCESIDKLVITTAIGGW